MSSTGTKRTAAEAGFDIDALIKNDERAKSKSSTVRSREMQGGGADGKKHSLDSDEEIEDNVAEEEKLHDDDIEGQEDITIEKEGEVKITPFNLKEEQEEGHFAKDGNFVWKKDKEVSILNEFYSVSEVCCKKRKPWLKTPVRFHFAFVIDC